MSKQKITEEKIRSTINTIVELFKTGNVPKAIATVTFPPCNVPSNIWSLANRLIMMLHDTSDARGFRQWSEVNRHVKKGERAFHILAPRIIKKKEEDHGKEVEKTVCTGFIPLPVFSVEQTDGEALAYEKIELPQLPLIEKAQEWGINVKGIAFQGSYYGYYQQQTEKIRLATPDETVFFHELAHAAHRRVLGNLKSGQDPKQEIVAELSAQVLSELVGTKIHSTLGNSYEYISQYAQKMGKKDIGKACLSVIADVERVLKLILEDSLVTTQ